MISVLVVDDSVVVRRLVTEVLSADPGIRVVGTAPNGRIALAKVEQLNPDLVTLDVEMPVMDGLTTVRELRKIRPALPIVMFSTLTGVGADATLAALAAGASDYVTKPTNLGSPGAAVESVREQLLPRIHALCERRAAVPPPKPRVRKTAGAPVRAIVVAASTGGPEALRVLVRALPPKIGVPILVVQHMPAMFTTMLARRLDAESPIRVVEAEPCGIVAPDVVHLAPGDKHMELALAEGVVRTRLHDGPKENHCRPAADPLFRSAAAVFGGATLAVVLTGMGRDGLAGAGALAAAGATIVVQDEASSVVWGMPGAVAGAGLADAVVPLRSMASRVLALLPARPLVPEVATWA